MTATTISNGGPAGRETPWLHRQFRRLRQRWWLPLLAVCAALVIAIIYLRGSQYVYSAELKIYPAASATGVRPTSGLGGLAALAGLGGGGGDAVPPFRYFVEGIFAPEVAARLARDPVIMHTVFSGQWHAGTGTWQEPPAGAVSRLLSGLNTALGRPVVPWHAPDADDLQRYIVATVMVQQSTQSPLSTLRFSHPDPAFAARFLGAISTTTDRWLREQQSRRTSDNIAFLSGQLVRTMQIDQREALVLALSEQEQRGMFSFGDAPYAAEHFDTVLVGSEPAKPRVMSLLIGSGIAGLLVGIVLALLPIPRRFRRQTH